LLKAPTNHCNQVHASYQSSSISGYLNLVPVLPSHSKNSSQTIFNEALDKLPSVGRLPEENLIGS
jgi:hypothetical protein